jgi:hypothetical protein
MSGSSGSVPNPSGSSGFPLNKKRTTFGNLTSLCEPKHVVLVLHGAIAALTIHAILPGEAWAPSWCLATTVVFYFGGSNAPLRGRRKNATNDEVRRAAKRTVKSVRSWILTSRQLVFTIALLLQWRCVHRVGNPWPATEEGKEGQFGHALLAPMLTLAGLMAYLLQDRRFFCRWFCEKPLPLFLQRSIRVILFAFMATAVVSAGWTMESRFFGLTIPEPNTLESLALAHPEKTMVAIFEFFNPFFFFALLFALVIHMAYWLILFEDLAYSRTAESLTWDNIVFPFLLVVSYLLEVRQPYNNSTTICSAAAFLCVYGLWAATAWAHIKQRKSWRTLPGERRRSAVWAYCDTFVAFYLALILWDFFIGFPRHSPHKALLTWSYGHTIGFKEFIMLVNLSGYFLSWFISYQTGGENQHYQIFGPKIRRIDQRRRSWIKPINHPFADKLCNVFDFGCGDGSCAIDTLSELGFQASNINLCGVDHDGSWRPLFEEACAARGVKQYAFIERSGLAGRELSRTDVIFCGHMLYERTNAHKLAGILAIAPKCRYLVITGCAPESFLAPLMNEAEIQPMWQNFLNRWDGQNLKKFLDLAAKNPNNAKLKVLSAENRQGQPVSAFASRFPAYGIVKRVLGLDENIMLHLAQWVELKLGYRIALRTRTLLSQQSDTTNKSKRVLELCFDDLVYVFEMIRSGATGDGVHSKHAESAAEAFAPENRDTAEWTRSKEKRPRKTKRSRRGHNRQNRK